MLLNILPHFLLQNFVSYFPLLQPKCVFWSEKYGIWQHLPLQGAVGPVLCTWLQRSQSVNLWPSRLSAVAWSKLAGGGIAIWFHMYLKVWWFCFLKQGYFSIFFIPVSRSRDRHSKNHEKSETGIQFYLKWYGGLFTGDLLLELHCHVWDTLLK